MANKEIEEETGLFKTNTSIEKLRDGTCMKRITKSINGKTEVTEEKVDCETALKEVQETDENSFKKENDDFDERMRDKLKDLNTSLSGGNSKITTLEESSGEAKNKLVKVTRESSSIEETKKLEKIPEGTKRTLKITRESFLEETKKDVEPNEPEEVTESVKLLDESFAEDENGGKSESKCDDTAQEKLEDEKQRKKNESDVEEENASESDENEIGDNSSDGRIVEEDGFLKSVVKTILKVIFYPLYRLNIL